MTTSERTDFTLKLKISVVFFLFYLTFAFDSMLKFDIGFSVHFGILLSLLMSPVLFVLNSEKYLKAIFSDAALLVFVLYCIISGLFLSSSLNTFLNLLSYLVMALVVSVFCSYSIDYLRINFLYYFQVLIVATGLLQFLLAVLFDVQISFIGRDHYHDGTSVSYRLRGLFIEPNWYAIAITFNTFLLVGNDLVAFIRKNILLFSLTMLVMVLNGTLATIGIFLLFQMYMALKDRPLIGIFISIVLIGIAVVVLSFRENVNPNAESRGFLNHSSRVEPFVRVLDYQSDKGIVPLLIGNGFATWGTDGVANRLSVLFYDVVPTRRDSSEAHVFIFELGLIASLLILLDSVRLYFKVKRSMFFLKGPIVLFVVCLFFYPVLKFLMYMPYYFIVRQLVLQRKSII